MPKTTSKVLIIIPFYNEAKRISKAKFSDAFEAYEELDFVLVDDGSTDKTPKVLEALSQMYDNVGMLCLGHNVGKAEAIRYAVRYSRNKTYDFIGFMDADLATPLVETKKLVDYAIVHSEKDIVMGTRVKLLGNKVERSLLRHYFGRVFATLVSQFVLKVPVYDTQCGAKIFKKSKTVSLFDDPFVTKWLFDIELLLRYKKLYGNDLESCVAEVPLYEWTEVKGTKIRWHEFISVPWQLLKLGYVYDR